MKKDLFKLAPRTNPFVDFFEPLHKISNFRPLVKELGVLYVHFRYLLIAPSTASSVGDGNSGPGC